jgi:hypothetical protein
MTNDELLYLDVEQVALKALSESLPKLLGQATGKDAFIRFFDLAYAMGFEAAKQMNRDGVDIMALDARQLSIVK